MLCRTLILKFPFGVFCSWYCTTRCLFPWLYTCNKLDSPMWTCSEKSCSYTISHNIEITGWTFNCRAGLIWSLFCGSDCHYNDVIMRAMASQINSPTIVYSTVYSGVNQRKHESSVSLAFVRGIQRGPVNFPHKVPVTRKMFPFDNVTMCLIKPDPVD